MNNKESVKLRKRKLTTGNTSLYLDIYLNGKREYEYLKLYLIPETSRADKEKNRETMRLAEAIKAKRVVEVQNHEYGFKNDFAENTRFFDYYKDMCDKRLGEVSKSNWGNWISALRYLEQYEKNQNITFAEITPKWVEGFKEFLDKKAYIWSCCPKKRAGNKLLSENSKQSYFNKLRACLNKAFEDRIIANNPLRGIESFKGEESTRMYLTLDELQMLTKVECEVESVRKAFLFSCLTGLRRSDIIKLTWGEVHQQGEYTRIIFKQKKTGGQEYLDINKQAAELMGNRKSDDEKVFDNIYTTSVTNEIIKVWIQRAGIKKDITFHCARHTFAVMMLDLGTDIYTVSKLLGHREIGTTQIYAKVLDKNKQAAVASIPDIL
ncbi:MAG: site-specific integrase [Muribaculaceae bacterium]|nr:site-specific integrase [Muribaculaceae bacterium]